MKKSLFVVVALQLLVSCTQNTNPSVQNSSDSVSVISDSNKYGEPLGGQPPFGTSPSQKDYDYQLKYQQAYQVFLWGLPAVCIYRFRSGAVPLGFKGNTIVSFSKPATPKFELITANSSTPYLGSYPDLRNGPVVMELPASGNDGVIYGQVVDAWQFTIADIGPSGLDKGKGGKFLFTPPGYTGKIPAGYIHVSSTSNRIYCGLRSIVLKGKTDADAFQFAHRLKVYNLSEAAKPPEQQFLDPSVMDSRYSTFPFYDERYFNDIYDIFTAEPINPKDAIMMGMLASLGIEKGKPFAPDETTKKAMRQAAIDVWFFIQNWFDHFPKEKLYWPDRHYASLLMTDSNQMFTWEYPDQTDITNRAMEYAWCTWMPKVLTPTPTTQYMMSMADSNGDLLQAGKLYKVTIPAEMPVKFFWALTIYDRATFGFIYSQSNRTTLSSYDLDNMKKNADGTVTLYVGPAAPTGLESNWIPTSGKRPLPCIRFYGPTDAMNNKTFKMPDFEEVK